MRNLNKEELVNIQGGKEASFLEKAAFIAGYHAGRALDLVHGFVHGLAGTTH